MQATVQPPSGMEAALSLRYELRDFGRFPIAPVLEKGNPGVYAQCVDIMGRTREFNERHLIGRVEALDAKAGLDHDFNPHEILKAGAPYGFLSMNIPGIFGGGNFGTTAAGVFAEEISAADAGVFVIYGAHDLALALILASLDLRVIVRVAREICEGDRNGDPQLLALAHTEPGGGSDVEDTADITRARLTSRYEKVPGGYKLNVRKVFISNGAYARYNIVTAFGDFSRPLESMMGFAVPADAPGFSIGRLEHKMGQRLSSAAEVICEDVFVPDHEACAVKDAGRVLDTVLSLTRGPVGAMSTGIVRGVIERTLAYLAQKRVRGHWLLEEQWVQLALADLLGALQAGRGLYMDAGLAGENWGIARAMGVFPAKLPRFVIRNPLYEWVVTRPFIQERTLRTIERSVPKATLSRLVAYSSIAKFACSDLAVQAAMKAMEILGEDANDPQWGVEKCMRDAKLAQIFEGTNQINRLHVTRGLVSRS